MYSLEGDGSDIPDDQRGIRLDHFDILRANHHVHRSISAETAIQAAESMPGKPHCVILQHHAVQYIRLPDEIRHKGVLRFIVNVRG